MPSRISSKNEVTLRRVSSMVRSFLSEMRSIAEELLSRGLRKSMQSMNPPDGNPSSNIMISLISSVRRRRLRILPGSVQNSSVAALSAAYDVEHLSEMMDLILSKPIFCSSLWSIISVLFSKSENSVLVLVYFSLRSPKDLLRRSFSSLMFCIGVTLPPVT